MAKEPAKRKIIIRPRPPGPFADKVVRALHEILEKAEGMGDADDSDGKLARVFQNLLSSLEGKELGDFDWNKAAVSLINEIRAELNLDLFLDQQLTQQISLGCIPARPGFQHGRFDAKMSKIPQDKKYYSEFPPLFLGRPTHIPPFDW